MAERGGRGSSTVEIVSEVYERARELAQAKRFTVKEYINERLRLSLDKEAMIHRMLPHISIESYEGNMMLLKDFKARGFVEVFLRDGKVYCEKDGSCYCDHCCYVWAIPEFGYLQQQQIS
jgi:hypothetical protein